jgi:1,4-alpha-glucan branching enzyme
MPGDDWQKFANLRLLFSYMFAQPAKKTLFMGGEFGVWSEWNHEASLDWHLLQFAPHFGVQRCVQDLNRLYREHAAMHELDLDHAGFEWIDADDADNSVIAFLRRSHTPEDRILVACNFTPVPRPNYRLGVPYEGFWREVFNSDAVEYGGTGQGNFGGAETTPIRYHGRPSSINITAPPLGAVFFKFERG